MSGSISMGSVGGPYLLTGMPSSLTRNFVKFHLIEVPKVPVSFALRNCIDRCDDDDLQLIRTRKSRQKGFLLREEREGPTREREPL